MMLYINQACLFFTFNHHLIHDFSEFDKTNRSSHFLHFLTHRIHGAAIYGNMHPINIPPLC